MVYVAAQTTDTSAMREGNNCGTSGARGRQAFNNRIEQSQSVQGKGREPFSSFRRSPAYKLDGQEGSCWRSKMTLECVDTRVGRDCNQYSRVWLQLSTPELNSCLQTPKRTIGDGPVIVEDGLSLTEANNCHSSGALGSRKE